MSSTLSLKTVYQTNDLSAQLEQALSANADLEQQLTAERQANVNMANKVKTARENADAELRMEIDILNAKLEKLQQERQMEKLERLVDNDKQKQDLVQKNKQLQSQLGEVKSALKQLQQLDPERLKKNLASQKKKHEELKTNYDSVSAKLKAANKQLKDQKAKDAETESMFVSKDKHWELSLTRFTFEGEDKDTVVRIKALDRRNGCSYVAVDLDGDNAVWGKPEEVPAEVSLAAGARIKKNDLATTPKL